jgi:hypothetical protein
MDWIQLLGAVGIGAIVTKILDVLWLQRTMQKSEHRKWLRENRLKAYSALAQELLAHGPWSGPQEPTQLFALAAEAMLLADNEQMARQIDDFLGAVSALRRRLEELSFEMDVAASSDEEEEAIRSEMRMVKAEARSKAASDARLLIERLRSSILHL